MYSSSAGSAPRKKRRRSSQGRKANVPDGPAPTTSPVPTSETTSSDTAASGSSGGSRSATPCGDENSGNSTGRSGESSGGGSSSSSNGRPLATKNGGSAAHAEKHNSVMLERIMPATPPQRYTRKQRSRTKPIWLVMAVAVALVNDDGLVLMAQRPANKHFGGTWEFPGGKMEPRETPEQAAAREMLEEVGVVIQPQDLTPLTFASHSYTNGVTHLLLPLFVCRKWKGEARGCEGQQIAWVAEGDLDGMPMPPADVSLIPAVRAAIHGRDMLSTQQCMWLGSSAGGSSSTGTVKAT